MNICRRSGYEVYHWEFDQVVLCRDGQIVAGPLDQGDVMAAETDLEALARVRAMTTTALLDAVFAPIGAEQVQLLRAELERRMRLTLGAAVAAGIPVRLPPGMVCTEGE